MNKHERRTCHHPLHSPGTSLSGWRRTLLLFVTKEEYPIVKEIENLDGKIIEAKLIGKSGGFLFIESPPDGKRF
jgi:hypothetical protein